MPRDLLSAPRLSGSGLGLTYSQAGFLVTIGAVANLFVNVPAGILVDIIGQKALPRALALLATGTSLLLSWHKS